MNILVTGADGFTARHLVPLLLKDPKTKLFLAGRRSVGSPQYFTGDLTQSEFVAKTLGAIQPDQIYHLAGSFTQDYSIDYPANVLSSRNLLQALVDLRFKCRVLLVGSAAEYGEVAPGDNPVREDQPLRAVSVYGLTKIFQTHLMAYYQKAHSLNLVMARPFNLLGKGMSEKLFVGKIEKQIENFKKGTISKIKTGSLASERDYIAVESAVESYRKVMERGKAGEVYNVGSGKPVKMSELLRGMLAEAGLSMDVVEAAGDPAPAKTNVPRIFADLEKINGLMG